MKSQTTLPPGKLPSALLGRLLKRYVRPDPRIRIGPGVGEDACAIDIGGRWLIAKSDPITFTAEDLGRYALIVNSNDIATRGAEPRWFLATLLLPQGKTRPSDVERHFRQTAAACRELGVSMAGGHVEVTPGIDRPLMAGFMLGEAPKGRLLATRDARPGDAIIVTKGAGIEFASIVAREKAVELKAAFSPRFVAACRSLSGQLSILPEARISRAYARSLHDPTEGGIATALHELADASGTGLEVSADDIPVSEEVRRLCAYYKVDPLGVISSGALLIACDPRKVSIILERLGKAGIKAAVIGRLRAKRRGRLCLAAGKRRPLPRYDRDEISRVL